MLLTGILSHKKYLSDPISRAKISGEEESKGDNSSERSRERKRGKAVPKNRLGRETSGVSHQHLGEGKKDRANS